MKFRLSQNLPGHQDESVGHMLILYKIVYVQISIHILCLGTLLCVQNQTETFSMVE